MPTPLMLVRQLCRVPLGIPVAQFLGILKQLEKAVWVYFRSFSTERGAESLAREMATEAPQLVPEAERLDRERRILVTEPTRLVAQVRSLVRSGASPSLILSLSAPAFEAFHCALANYHERVVELFLRAACEEIGTGD